MSRPHGHSAAGRIKSIKSPYDPIGNGHRDLLACSTVTKDNHSGKVMAN